MWVVYIIYSKHKNKTYTGSTNNFKRRFTQHNKGEVEATKLYKPWIPIYLEFYPNEKSARNREKELKTSPGRRYLKKVINNIINEWAYSSVG
ncbi:MAG: GIY-YIG nuclease family protein [Patescibacteria group bacterium]